MQQRTKRIIFKTLRIVGWTVASVLVLLLLVIVALQLPSVQQKITQRAVSLLQEKIGTKVALKRLYVSFPKNIVVEGLYLEDQSGDTLLYAGKLFVNTDLLALTKREIQLNNIDLENTTAYVNQWEGDSTYNFSYILHAFAGDSTAAPDTLDEKSWNFTIEKVKLSNIRGHYHNKLAGDHADVILGEFEVSLDEFDLARSAFFVDEIRLENTRVNVLQTKLPEEPVEVEQSNDTATIRLNLKKAVLSNILASYTQQAIGQLIRLKLGESELEADKIDLKNQTISLDEFSLKKTFLAYHQLRNKNSTREQKQVRQPSASKPSSGIPSAQSAPVQKQKAWAFTLNKLLLEDNSIQYYDMQKPFHASAIDFDHLWVTALNLDARDIAVNGAGMNLDLRDFAFLEKSGFSLHTLRGKAKVSQENATVTDLILETGNSLLKLEAGAAYESFDKIAETYPAAGLRVTLKQSHIGMRDLLYFDPNILDRIPLKIPPDARIAIDASTNGKIRDLAIHHLMIHLLDDTHLQAKGTLAGLPDPNKLNVNLELDTFYTTRNDLLTILPDSLLPDSIALPHWINVNGAYKGNPEKGTIRTLVATSLGSIDLEGEMNLDSLSPSRGIEGKLAVQDFNLGELLMQPRTIGKLNLLASVDTHGLTKEEMDGTFHAAIHNFQYQGHVYNNFKLAGKIEDQVVHATASLPDSSLNFTLAGAADFHEDVPHYDLTFDLKEADFKALNLAERPLKARGTLDVDLATDDMKVLNGTIDLRKVAIFNGDALYQVDSLLFASVDQEGYSRIKIDSDLLQGAFEGSFNIFQMPAVLREYFNTYYSLHDSVKQSYESPQHFRFDLNLKKTELITDILFPELKTFRPGKITGEFDSEANQLNMHVDVSDILYSNIGVKSFLLSTNSDSSRLRYNIFVDDIRIDSMKIDGLEFNGTVGDDSLRTNFIVMDSTGRQKFMLGGTFFSHADEYELRLNPREIKLNYENWHVPADNYIRFGGEKIVAQHVEVAHGHEKIIFESKENPGAPLFIGFRELNLENLVSMFTEGILVSGRLQGDINLHPEKEKLRFTSNVGIRDLRLADIPWGNLTLKVEQKTEDRFDVDFRILGDKNNVAVNGYYRSSETPAIHLTTTISTFDLSVLQPLAQAQVSNLKGTLTGKIDVSGTPESPRVQGGATFHETQFLPTFLNSPFTIKDETISFDNRGAVFDSFQLTDASNNLAVLDGRINTPDYQRFRFDLRLKANNFRLLNTTAQDNELFYGSVGITTNTTIQGTMLNPKVDMEVSLTDDSKFTYVVPQEEASVMAQEGIVKFVDRSFQGDPFIKKIQPELADTLRNKFTGIDLTAKVELTDQEMLTVIIDPATRDQLTVKGNATLTLQMDRTGDMQLTGRYEITDGTYNLSFYKFVKREFNIEKGSSMTWAGDPLDAKMDLHAIYKIETSPIDLLSNQLTGSDPQEVNRYKQRIPFWVYLNIGGQLLKPDISFRLDMPVEQRNAFGGNVYAKLQDINTRESDLNKQVFALLILKRFIADNPFESQAGGGFETAARNSVSKILTDQLNRLSQNVRGVELSFDVKSYEDYSSGQAQGQTQLQLGLSKSLMKDRLVVKLAGNVDIEGQNTQRDVTDYIGDLALEYKLTTDGRFRITGFRNSNYDMIDGELTETGAGLIYIKDYNALSELFKANATTQP